MTGFELAPTILKLSVERFRSISSLVWRPGPGVNVLLGGGDVGKTTVLDAIALLLSPTNAGGLSETDYWCRQVEAGFSIEAVMLLPDSCGMSQQGKMAWPWVWDGKEPQLPAAGGGEEAASGTAVYRVRARGTEDLEVAFEILQPDGSVDHFPVSVRRRIGLIRLGGDDRNDRDLRLIQGSALDRFISGKALKPRISRLLSESDIQSQLAEQEQKSLDTLEKAFRSHALPTNLGLGFTSGYGGSAGALVGLTALKGESRLPLAVWGAGTRRLAALRIAATLQGEHPIAVVDELERGLEPYRQRSLVRELLGASSQVFLTTHSASVLAAAADAATWYMDAMGSIGPLVSSTGAARRRDPEAFLARTTIVAEGATEVGFLRRILVHVLNTDPVECGIWVADGGGHDSTLQLLEDLSDSGLRFGGFADNEGRYPTRWARLDERLGSLLFRWPSGCIEENVLGLVPDSQLEDFIRDAEGESGARLRTLADRLGIADKSYSAVSRAALDLRRLIIEAATGAVPRGLDSACKEEKKALKRHAEVWFKSVAGGMELGAKVLSFGLWPRLQGVLSPFLDAIQTEALGDGLGAAVR